MMKSAQFHTHSFQKISDEELHQQTLRAAEGEKQATLVLLEHLVEVDQRRLHLKRGYSSLWEYAHQALGYSESQASERVSSMRLMVKVPEVRQELKSGQINLTVISKLASHVKREKLESPGIIELLKEVKSKPTRQVEKILAQESTEPARPDRIKVVTPTTTRITIDVDDEFMELLKRVKELKGNHAASPKELFQSAMREFVKKREPKSELKSKGKSVRESESKDIIPLRAQKVRPVIRVKTQQTSRYIPVSVKRVTQVRSGGQCEYVDPASKRRCRSRSGLQFDHYPVPFALGGQSTSDNIRHLCFGHNRLTAIQVFGEEKCANIRL